MDGVPITSVAAETMFARVKRRADRGGIARHDTRMGAVLAERDGTVEWLRDKPAGEKIWRLAARRWRKGSGSRTMQQEREIKGALKAPEREAKLEKKRGGRKKKAEELERLKACRPAPRRSPLAPAHRTARARMASRSRASTRSSRRWATRGWPSSSSSTS